MGDFGQACFTQHDNSVNLKTTTEAIYFGRMVFIPPVQVQKRIELMSRRNEALLTYYILEREIDKCVSGNLTKVCVAQLNLST